MTARMGWCRWGLLLALAAAAPACTQPNPAFRLTVGDGGGSPADSRDGASGGGPDGGGPADPALSEGPPEPPPRDGPAPIPEVGSADTVLPDALAAEVPPPDAATPDSAAPPVDAAQEVSGPPPALVFSSIPGTETYGGSGGAGTSIFCGANQVLIGYTGHFHTAATGLAPVVSRLEGRCGRLAVTTSPPYRVTVTASGSLPAVGDGDVNPFSALCPAGQVMVGFFGREGTSLDQVGFRCAPLIIEMTPRATLVLGAITELGRWPATTSGTAFGENCRSSGLAHGHIVNHGAWIDAMSLHCTGVSLAP